MRVAADRTGMIAAQAMAGKELEIPDPDEARARYDALLIEVPDTIDSTMADIRKALGV